MANTTVGLLSAWADGQRRQVVIHRHRIQLGIGWGVPGTEKRDSAYYDPSLQKEADMDTTTLLIIIVVLLLLGGGWYGRGRWY